MLALLLSFGGCFPPVGTVVGGVIFPCTLVCTVFDVMDVVFVDAIVVDIDVGSVDFVAKRDWRVN